MIAAPKGSGVDSMYPTIMMLAVGLEPIPLALREGRPNTIRTCVPGDVSRIELMAHELMFRRFPLTFFQSPHLTENTCF